MQYYIPLHCLNIDPTEWHGKVKDYCFATTIDLQYNCWAENPQNYIAWSITGRLLRNDISLYCITGFEHQSQLSQVLINSAWSYQHHPDFQMHLYDVPGPSEFVRPNSTLADLTGTNFWSHNSPGQHRSSVESLHNWNVQETLYGFTGFMGLHKMCCHG
jgi:hypothetical protein